MMDHYYWLTPETTRPTAEQLMDAVRETIRTRDSRPVTVQHEHEAIAVYEGREAGRAIQSAWFFASVGIVDNHDKSKETFYLSTSPNVYRFSSYNIVPWTNWLGDLVTRIREALKRGEFPKELEYGPPNNRVRLPVGPLADYAFREGQLQSFEFRFGRVPAVTAPELEAPPPSKPAEEKRTFGLKEIIRTIDLAQNDRIRGPKSGVFVLVGGPGVGKTTVALHRIPFLINEQVGYDERGRRKVVDPEDLFFRQTNMLVVVWKVHLVPYLRRCIEQLGMREFPPENVSHVDDWVERTLRRYVRIGPSSGSVRIRPEVDAIAEAKLTFNEADIDEFLASEYPLKLESGREIAAAVDHIRSTIAGTGYSPRHGFAASAYDFTVAGVNAVADEFLRQLPEPERFGRYTESVHRALEDRIEQMRTAELDRVTSYVKILRQFYASQVVADRLGTEYDDAFIAEFGSTIQKQADSRSISRNDMFLLLWIIHAITVGSDARTAKQRSLPTYSHVTIDEAQYYHPLVLRLFAELARLPDGSMTIVGDLEQKITSRGGLATWEEIGLEIPPENIQRLVTNYRWSRQVFDFLKIFRKVAGIREQLKRPSDWYSGEGRKPSIEKFADRTQELHRVAESVSELRDQPASELWTVAVVVPGSQEGDARTKLVELLTSYGVSARWADGEDVKESVDRVIVTNFDSIVGLEFDAVYVIAVDEVLPDLLPEHVHSVWVALTRARYYLHVSRVGSDAVFGAPAFARFRA